MAVCAYYAHNFLCYKEQQCIAVLLPAWSSKMLDIANIRRLLRESALISYDFLTWLGGVSLTAMHYAADAA